MTKNDIVFETPIYKIIVASAIDYEGPCPDRILYQIYNKDTGVMELEDFTLPGAIETAKYLTDCLVSIREGKQATVVGISKNKDIVNH